MHNVRFSTFVCIVFKVHNVLDGPMYAVLAFVHILVCIIIPAFS